jgi:hypothetical protein
MMQTQPITRTYSVLQYRWMHGSRRALPDLKHAEAAFLIASNILNRGKHQSNQDIGSWLDCRLPL